MTAALPPPFFVMGCEASGNNLLSLMLNSHSRMCVFLGSHYYQFFEPHHEKYGDLSRPENARRLVKDLVASVRSRRLDLPLPAASDVMDQISAGTFEGVLAGFLGAYARLCGKPHVGERTSRHFVHLDRILEKCPNSPVIFTMRDPRDSFYFVRDGLGMSCESLAADWNAAYRNYQARSRPVHLVRYEELVAEPRRTLSKACEFLGESFEPQMLEFHHNTPTHFLQIRHHQRLGTPVDPSSIGIYRRLTEDEILRVERGCSDGMNAMGYSLTGPPTTASYTLHHIDGGMSRTRKVVDRARYYGFNAQRWQMGLLRWIIVSRVQVRHRLRRMVRLG